MSDTPRDQDARAAMREVLRGLVTGDIDGPMSPAEMAHDAWNYADAMATERAKREAAEAPAPEHHACHAEIAAAMREGRDAGLRKAVDWLADNGYGGAGMALARYIANHLTADAPPGVT